MIAKAFQNLKRSVVVVRLVIAMSSIVLATWIRRLREI